MVIIKRAKVHSHLSSVGGACSLISFHYRTDFVVNINGSIHTLFFSLSLAADGYSIYIRGLPLNAVPALLEDEFKKFGPIKSDGIQVRSNKVRIKLFYLSNNFDFLFLLFNGIYVCSRAFVLALLNLRWQVLCKKQLR